MGWWEGNIKAVLKSLYHSNVYNIQWMAAMMPVTAGIFAHEIALLCLSVALDLDLSWENHASLSAWKANRSCVIPMAVYLEGVSWQ